MREREKGGGGVGVCVCVGGCVRARAPVHICTSFSLSANVLLHSHKYSSSLQYLFRTFGDITVETDCGFSTT